MLLHTPTVAVAGSSLPLRSRLESLAGQQCAQINDIMYAVRNASHGRSLCPGRGVPVMLMPQLSLSLYIDFLFQRASVLRV